MSVKYTLIASCILHLGCHTEPVTTGSIPVDPEWPAVSQMLGARCGSLDCHGQTGRPLRLYSGRGLRLDPDDVPGGESTTNAEHDANLRAAVGLEPELTAEVFAGASPRELTLYRKALGLEKHKGLAPLATKGDGEHCLRTWLAGAADQAACEAAADLERPTP